MKAETVSDNYKHIFDRVYVVSLVKKYPEKLSAFLKRLPNPWIFGPIKVFEAIYGYESDIPKWWIAQKGAWGCYQSHLKIIEECIKDKVDKVLILEDDAIFCKDFTDKARNFLTNLPDDWEQAYLGGQHLRMPRSTIVEKNITIGSNINRTHAYAIHGQGFNKLYSWLNNTDAWVPQNHIDHHYGILHQAMIIKPYCPIQFLVGQSDGISSITNKKYGERWWN